jgi:hypothetical protein
VLGGVEVAAVGEGVGCDVEDAHDESARAQRESAGSQAPVEAGTREEGHEDQCRTVAGRGDCSRSGRGYFLSSP